MAGYSTVSLFYGLYGTVRPLQYGHFSTVRFLDIFHVHFAYIYIVYLTPFFLISFDVRLILINFSINFLD